MNQTLEETLALRDYDLRMNNIRVHLDLASDLPVTAADPHQLQQVFLNMVNNAADAILERSTEGDRKSTRLNSSHGYISYAVFCLKKKKNSLFICWLHNSDYAEY